MRTVAAFLPLALAAVTETIAKVVRQDQYPSGMPVTAVAAGMTANFLAREVSNKFFRPDLDEDE
jgi:ABC-type uncharacterized transport system permease subunit